MLSVRVDTYYFFNQSISGHKCYVESNGLHLHARKNTSLSRLCKHEYYTYFTYLLFNLNLIPKHCADII